MKEKDKLQVRGRGDTLLYLKPGTSDIFSGSIRFPWLLGAKPPWLTEEDEGDGSEKQIGPSYEEFLRQSEQLAHISVNFELILH